MVYHSILGTSVLSEAYHHYHRTGTILNTHGNVQYGLFFWLAINCVLTLFTLLLSLMHIVLVSINKTTL